MPFHLLLSHHAVAALFKERPRGYGRLDGQPRRGHPALELAAYGRGYSRPWKPLWTYSRSR